MFKSNHAFCSCLQRGKWFSAPSAAPAPSAEPGSSTGVGKYLKLPGAVGGAALANKAAGAAAIDEGGTEATEAPPAKKPKTVAGGFGNFDAW
jgi:hypothetical protein